MADVATKVTAEKYAAVALVLVFGWVLTNALQKMGVFGRHQPVKQASATRTEPIEKTDLSKPLPEMFQEHRKKIEELPAELASASAPAPAAPATTGYAAQALRDPLQSLLPVPERPAEAQTTTVASTPEPPAPPAVSPPALMVQGLWWGSDTPSAIINGKVYAVGSEVGGAKILSISREGVLVEFEGTTMRLVPGGEASQRGVLPSRPGGTRAPS